MQRRCRPRQILSGASPGERLAGTRSSQPGGHYRCTNTLSIVHTGRPTSSAARKSPTTPSPSRARSRAAASRQKPLAMRQRRETAERTGSLRTQSARHRVDHGTICGRSCANSGHYKPLCACVDRFSSGDGPVRLGLVASHRHQFFCRLPPGDNLHDTGSTTARSVDEVALIRDTISHDELGLVWSPASPTGINFFE
jgi:hypothetical protein